MLKGDKQVGKVFDRLLLFLYSLAVGIAAVFVLITASAWVSPNQAAGFLHNVYYDPNTAYSLIAVSLILIAVSLRFLVITLRRGRGQAPSIDQRTDFGDIRISIETVENLSLKAASRIRGVKDLKARVSVGNAGLEIVIRTIVDGETPIPDLTEEVQRLVKEHVEEITGIPVAFVSVFVANIISSTPSFKSRVE